MGASIFKQPNGLLGRYSYVCDDFTDYNMTEEEYIVNNIRKSVEDSRDTINRYQGDYEKIIADAKAYEDCFDEWIKEPGTTKKEKEKYLKDKEKRHQRTEAYIEVMNSDPSVDDKKWHTFCHELYNVLENFYIYYDTKDWKYEKKPYFVPEHIDDIMLFTEKLKELNTFFEQIKNERICNGGNTQSSEKGK